MFDQEELLQTMEREAMERTTHATEMNSDSSRSHAIFCIELINPIKKQTGYLYMIDLAGSERGQDTKLHNKERRTESAAINTSLLALKECIRALEMGCKHIPFRGSKLTHILKDSFSANSRTIMINCVSPMASSSDHTVNTLRYGATLKERKKKKGTSVRGGQRGNSTGVQRGSNNTTQRASRNGSTSTSQRGTTQRSVTNQRSTIQQQRSTQQQSSVSKREVTSPMLRERKESESPTKKRTIKSTSTRSNTRSSTPTREEEVNSSHSRRQQTTRQEHHGQQENYNNKRQPNQVDVKPLVIKKKVLPPPSSFQDVVSALVDEEEALLRAHLECIQLNAKLLSYEGKILSKVQGDEVVDYDIDEYAKALDEVSVFLVLRILGF